MESPIQFLLRHGYLLMTGVVFAEQIGLPLPALPVLIAMGALAGLGHFSLAASLAWAVIAAVIADSMWYWLGRRRGMSVLRLLCRISLEPDSCVTQTKQLFGRLGWPSLLLCKFIPGFSTAAPPLAAVTGMKPAVFAIVDAAGSLLWAGTFLGLGFVFHNQVERLTDTVLRTGSMALFTVGGTLALYLSFKFLQRERFLRALRMARIEPEDLYEQLSAGEEPVIVDLRHALELEREPITLPGAIHIDPKEIETRHVEIPRDRDVIVFCS